MKRITQRSLAEGRSMVFHKGYLLHTGGIKIQGLGFNLDFSPPFGLWSQLELAWFFGLLLCTEWEVDSGNSGLPGQGLWRRPQGKWPRHSMHIRLSSVNDHTTYHTCVHMERWEDTQTCHTNLSTHTHKHIVTHTCSHKHLCISAHPKAHVHTCHT